MPEDVSSQVWRARTVRQRHAAVPRRAPYRCHGARLLPDQLHSSKRSVDAGCLVDPIDIDEVRGPSSAIAVKHGPRELIPHAVVATTAAKLQGKDSESAQETLRWI